MKASFIVWQGGQNEVKMMSYLLPNQEENHNLNFPRGFLRFVLMVFLFLYISGNSLAGPPPTNAPENTTLKCSYPMWNIPPVTHRVLQTGDQVKINIGINSSFGGVGVEFNLINRAYPNSPVNILEARSAAGAGWQFTSFTHAYDGNEVIFNQADGNARGYQWGNANNYDTNNNYYINAIDWAPNYSDTFNNYGTSPCETWCYTPPNCINNFVVFDAGALSIGTALFSTAHGRAVALSNLYTLKSKVDQYWQWYRPLQAIYLNRQIARQGNLRFYLVGKSGWKEGPIYPYDTFSISHATLSYDLSNNPVWTVSPDTKYVVFVWNIYGLDIGVAISNMTDRGALRLAKKVYCTDSNNDTCGSIDWETFLPLVNNASFPAGTTRGYQIDYRIGTLQQLADLGYPIQ